MSASDRTDILAAVDIGTNSVHLVVARVTDSGRMEILEQVREVVRLGSSGGDMKRLTPEAIDRGIEALTHLAGIARARDALMVAVATSAVREAENRSEFITRARAEAGVAVDVISGIEEARLIHLGVLQAVPLFDQQMLLCDIGGGSTEVVVGKGAQMVAARSLRVGAIRLTERFLRGERLERSAVQACRRFVRSELTPFAAEVHRLGFEVAVASSGTAEALARMVAARQGIEPKTYNNFVLTADDLDETIAELLAAETTSERAAIKGLEARRADIIVGGALVLEQIVREFELEQVVVSEYALREGVLLDFANRLREGALHHLRDLRRQSVLHLADVADDDAEHSAHVADLALQLFDETAALHGLGDDSRELLEAAALLANVGMSISHSGHHKHSYYIIRHSEHLSGFTDREIELIALIARYHRKSAPRSRHSEFEVLSDEDKVKVTRLAGLLRIAIGLDRHYAARVELVHAEVIDGRLVVEATPAEGADIDLELYAAIGRAELLSEALDLPIDLVAAAPSS